VAVLFQTKALCLLKRGDASVDFFWQRSLHVLTSIAGEFDGWVLIGVAGEAAVRLAGEFTWDIEAPATLMDIDLSVPAGAFVAIVGQTGSGKSSMLSAALGLMQQVQGPPVVVRGKVRLLTCILSLSFVIAQHILAKQSMSGTCVRPWVASLCIYCPACDTICGKQFSGQKVAILRTENRETKAVYHFSDHCS
jgi:energy-coupling factor transporter ATP-binding protein EcfA2